MWDELAAAAWLDPSLITKQETRYLSVDIDHGAGQQSELMFHFENELLDFGTFSFEFLSRSSRYLLVNF